MTGKGVRSARYLMCQVDWIRQGGRAVDWKLGSDENAEFTPEPTGERLWPMDAQLR
jgi:hypothetical protein